MERVCPVCNAIIFESFPCEKCKSRMVDKGRIQDFFDPYSGAMPIENVSQYCTHVYQCEVCGNMKNFSIKNIYP
jgi:hypothetical protein